MRLLLITGQLASRDVRAEAERIERQLGHRADVLVLGVKVASLMTVSWLEEALKPYSGLMRSYDLAILPGYTHGDASELTSSYGIPFVKGTKHIKDLFFALRTLGPQGLSPDKPADALLEEALDPEGKLAEAERAMGDFVRIGDVKLPIRPPPMRLVSEVYLGPGMALEGLLEECRLRAEAGADLVCVGFRDPSSIDLGELRTVIRALKDELGTLAIDDPMPSHIREAVRQGADLILSVSTENVDAVARHVEPETAYVLVAPPGLSPSEKLKALRRLSEELEARGAEKLILDPLLEPPIESGFFRSLTAYDLVARELPGKPMMMGFCNVSELLDADSPGVNALLACLAAELGVSLVLTTEESPKTRRSTYEAGVALKMASLALLEHKTPKDLGLDLLVLKDKVDKTVRLGPELLKGAAEVSCGPAGGLAYKPDPVGFFRITVDEASSSIMALYEGRRGKVLLRGPDAASVVRCVLDMGLASTPEHVAYLARELTKAELALRVGKSYVQDEPLF